MIYVGNYNYWINNDWLEDIKNTEGIKVPRDLNLKKEVSENIRSNPHPDEISVYDVYGNNCVFFDLLESNIFNFKIDPPWLNEPFNWWITKMAPGQFIPVHKDGPIHINGKRFWMPLTPWEPGHIFLYEDKSVSKYEVGDLWVYEDPLAAHGGINIGKNTRIILQVSTFGIEE
jgi:hypothetical protein